MKTKNILIIGSLNTDLVVSVQRMPLMGETVLGKSISYVQGGKGANQAYAAARAGGNVTMLGCVGADEFGSVQIENLSNAGVDVSKIKISDKSPTGTAIIYVDEKGNNSIVVVAAANNDCNVEYIKENDDVLQACDYIMMQMEIPWETNYYAIKRAKQLGKTIILDPAPVSDPLPDEIYPMIDYITPNETEIMKLTSVKVSSIDDAEKGAKALLEKGVENVVVTLGKAGAMHVTNSQSRLFPARQVAAVDTTAAGDCFNAVFAAVLAEGKSEDEAIEIANTASSISVRKIGAQSSIPSRDEIENEVKF